MTGPIAIWQHLFAEGRVDDAVPDLPDPGTPWPLRLLAGVGAWIATPLLLGFIGLLLGDLLASPNVALVLGPLLAAGTVPLLRQPASEFVHQAATVVSLVGLLLFAWGLSGGLDLGDRPVAAALAIAAAALFAVSREPVHRFACAGVALAAAAWLLAGPNGARLALLQPLLAWLAAAAWLVDARLEPQRDRIWREAVPPAAWAATLAALVLAWIAPHLRDPVASAGAVPMAVAGSGWLALALFPAVALALLWPRRTQLGPVALALLLLASLVLAWSWRGAPMIGLALSLLLLAFAAGIPALLALALAALAGGLVAYYYQLAVPLLDKALGLAVAGALLAVLHVGLRRWPRGAPP